jgi:hypothetical protein
MAFNFGAFKSLAIAQAAPFVPAALSNIAGVFGLGITLPGGPSSSNWNRVKVDLTLLDEETGEYWPVPVIPEAIPVKEGAVIRNSVNVINVGPVEFFNGANLDEIGWESFFPARYDESYCSTPAIKKPMDYVGMYGAWKAAGIPIRVICPAAEINLLVVITEFTWKLVGFEGDIEYSITFRQHRTVVPKQVATGGELPPKGKKLPEERPPVPK